MDKIKLEIIGISISQSQSGAYALILGEIDGKRRLPIIIGGFEAQAIAIELEKMKPTRPLTHDLFKSFAQTFNISVKEVIINKFSDGVFYAKLICIGDGLLKEIDARTSDAVAIAIRFNCPIYSNESILKAAGIIMDDDSLKKKSSKVSDYRNKEKEYDSYTTDELETLLKDAIENENYEIASKIRDEINNRIKDK